MNARVTILREASAEVDPRDEQDADAETAFDAAVLVLDQPFMELMAPQPVAGGAAVRIDTCDAIWLGEVEGCSSEGAGYLIRVRLQHVLRDFETLARLAERFGGSGKTRRFPVEI